MKKFIVISTAAAAVVATVSTQVADDVEAQATGFPPLFAGIDSQGAYPLPQSPDPLLFFEAKAYWPALNIEQPRTAWEYVQRGIYKQDELEDVDGAIADYMEAERLNDHILLIHARLGYINLKRGKELASVATSSAAAIAALTESVRRYDEVLEEQPHREGIHAKLGEAYQIKYGITRLQSDADKALEEYQAELNGSPTFQKVLYERAKLFRDLGRRDEARASMEAYLAQTVLHGDPYPYKILAARKFLQDL